MPMDDKYLSYISNLNNPDKINRLESLSSLKKAVDRGELPRPEVSGYINNHIHTTYSFSPYSPSKAIWMAYSAGLATAGIVDHDTVAGTEEFIEAGIITGMATTVGMECRVDFKDTPLNGRRLNNTDQESIAYVALHGIPRTKIAAVNEYMVPYRMERNKRNRLMVEKLNSILETSGILLDFDQDVVPLSMSCHGGSITERHILFALSKKLIEKFGQGSGLIRFIKEKMGVELTEKAEKYLLDGNNPYYAYDLLGALKSEISGLFYINVGAECPKVAEYIALAEKTGAISAYAYLGDVTDSVTGDKKAQKFEDDYIDLLFDVIRELGFNAVTYIPSRNTPMQLRKVKDLCTKYGLFEISGEDINSPRQSFVCQIMQSREFENLKDSTWALIGHETASGSDIRKGMFSVETKALHPELDSRIRHFKDIGMKKQKYTYKE